MPNTRLPNGEWRPVGNDTPHNKWLETKLDGEEGTNVCACIVHFGDDVEWVEKVGGRTTVTHHSFAAPTHWRYWQNPKEVSTT